MLNTKDKQLIAKITLRIVDYNEWHDSHAVAILNDVLSDIDKESALDIHYPNGNAVIHNPEQVQKNITLAR